MIDKTILQKHIQKAFAKPQAKQLCLIIEHKFLQLYCVNFSILVMPELNNAEVWHGLMMVRFGLYKDGRFKFRMHFEEFPQKPPKVYFISKVWHPLVELASGLLDLGIIEKQWNYGKQHLIFTVIDYIRRIFLDPSTYKINTSYNPKAGQQFVAEPRVYLLKVRHTVDESRKKITINDPNSSLKLGGFTETHQKMLLTLKSVCSQSVGIEKKKMLFLKKLQDIM